MRLPVSFVDSTISLRWELTKEEFDNCGFPNRIVSPNYTAQIGSEESEWFISMYPRGENEQNTNKVMIYLVLNSKNKMYRVHFHFGIETPTGFWPIDSVKNLYSRESFDECTTFTPNSLDETGEGYDSWGEVLCTTEELGDHFVENKLCIVASLVIYMEGDGYRNHMEIADDFMVDMRFMSSLKNLSDVTIVCGDKRFPCHRVLLAARSDYFEALFRNEPEKREVKMEEPLELVEALLDYMTKGRIPNDIDTTAMDLILMADMYRLDLLTIACETSLVNNLTPENASEALINIDKVKHVSKSEHRHKILAYIKKEAAQVIRTKDWDTLIKNYPGLVNEIVLALSKM